MFQTGEGSDIIYGRGVGNTLDYSTLSGGVSVDLAAGTSQKAAAGQGWSLGNASIAYTDEFSDISNVIGSNFGDKILADAGAANIIDGAGNDVIVAYAGNDTIDAGLGRNRLYSGTGLDAFTSDSSQDAAGQSSNTFIYSNTKGSADTIANFLVGTDKIDFLTAGGGAFTTAYNGAAGSASFAEAANASALAAAAPTLGFGWEADTGALYFYKGGAATLVADVSTHNGVALTANDIQLVTA